MIKKGLKPVCDVHTETLIVGTFPGEESLRLNQYYANTNNQFWQILGTVLKEDLKHLAYTERLNTLLKHKIGLWDAIATHEGAGSVDSNITNPTYNDFTRLKNLKRIVCHSEEAEYYLKMCKLPPRINIFRVTSPSGTNTHYTVTEKADIWKKVIHGDS